MSDDQERPKRSWREVDMRKDRASGGGRRSPSTQTHNTLKGGAAKRYMAQLDRMFQGGGIPEEVKRHAPAIGMPEKSALQQKRELVLAATTPAEIAASVDALLAEHEMPNDAELLAKILAHPQSKHVEAALNALVDVLDAGKPTNARLLKTRVQTLKLTIEDDDICRLADIALAML